MAGDSVLPGTLLACASVDEALSPGQVTLRLTNEARQPIGVACAFFDYFLLTALRRFWRSIIKLQQEPDHRTTTSPMMRERKRGIRVDYVPFGTSLWYRPEYVALRPKEKLLCLYLKTNPRLTVSGIYPIAVETVAKAISTYVPYAMMMLASLPGIEYDCEKSCVFVRDHFRAMCLRSDGLHRSHGRERTDRDAPVAVFVDDTRDETPP